MRNPILLLSSILLLALPLSAELIPVQLIEGTQPPYPEALKQRGDDGQAKIQVTIDETGRVSEASVVSASHPAFGESARETVKEWRFKPAEKDGEAVPQTVAIPFVFKLSFEDRLNALAGHDVFVDINELTEKVHTWGDVKKYFPLRKNMSRIIDYPESLKGSGISEEITIQCVISPDGRVLNPKILNLKTKEFAVPAVEHVVQLAFQRPKLNGEPIYLQQKVKLICSETPEKFLKKK